MDSTLRACHHSDTLSRDSVTLLSIDTAGDLCSVALLEGGSAVVALTLDRPRSHAERLAPMIAEAVELAGLCAADLDVIAVSAGPGSYTGLRIGVSTAKGLCYASGAKLVGVDTLLARCMAIAPGRPLGSCVAAVVPSRRHEVYLGIWRVAENGLEVERPSTPMATGDAARVLEGFAERQCLVTGEGVGRLPDGVGATIIAWDAVNYDARWIARAGLGAVARDEFEDAASFEPIYLKPFVALRGASAFDRLPDMSP